MRKRLFFLMFAALGACAAAMAAPAGQGFSADMVSRQLLGKETVNGRAAEKYKVTYETNGRQESILQYVSDGWIPVRVQSEDGTWSVDYQNVSVGAQSPDLFELPAGYRKFEMPAFGAVLGAQNAGVDAT